jgi:hypothetical protein
LYVFLGYFLCFLQFREYSEFRANEGAQSAFHAVLSLKHYLGRMISFRIEVFAFLQTTVGAELNAKTAAFAAVPDYVYFSMRYRVGLGVEGQAPEFHHTSP